MGRPFTPGGHLIGSIGEVVAEYIYGLVLEDPSCGQFDARTRDGRSVQIKLTGKKGSRFGFRWSNSRPLPPPDLLIGLKLTHAGYVEVFSGPFPTYLLERRSDSSNGQLSIAIATLAPINPRSLPQFNSPAEFNQLFVQDLSNG